MKEISLGNAQQTEATKGVSKNSFLFEFRLENLYAKLKDLRDEEDKIREQRDKDKKEYLRREHVFEKECGRIVILRENVQDTIRECLKQRFEELENLKKDPSVQKARDQEIKNAIESFTINTKDQKEDQ